jgi:deoxyribonuclease V
MELHRWDVSYAEAREIQSRLSLRLRFPLKEATFRWVGGADVAYDETHALVVAAVVVLDARSGEIVEQADAAIPSRFPYIPGLLSFREAPAVIYAWEKLARKPELLLLDGQGIAHPRRFGLACHLGLWLDVPTLGCAKSRLIGQYLEPGWHKSSWSELRDGNNIVGAVVRTRDNVRPLFVSPGYLLPLSLCVQVVLEWCGRYRIPEPTRKAHIRVTELRRQLMQGTLSAAPLSSGEKRRAHD